MDRWMAYFIAAALCVSASFFTVAQGDLDTEIVKIKHGGSENDLASQKTQNMIENAQSLSEEASDVSGKLMELAKLSVSDGEQGKEGEGSRGGGRNINTQTNLSQKSGYSASQLEKALKGTQLEGIAEYAVVAEHMYGVDALFIISLAQHESGNGDSSIANGKNNLFGIGAYDSSPGESALTYSSRQECIMEFARMISENYFERGYKNLGQIGQRYASDSLWAQKISRAMQINEAKILK